MTSNLGVKKLQDFGVGVGFDTKNRMTNNEEIKKSLLRKELKNYFTPEFLNRVDEIIIFNQLKENEVSRIVTIELSKLKDRLDSLNYVVEISGWSKNYIHKVGL